MYFFPQRPRFFPSVFWCCDSRTVGHMVGFLNPCHRQMVNGLLGSLSSFRSFGQFLERFTSPLLLPLVGLELPPPPPSTPKSPLWSRSEQPPGPPQMSFWTSTMTNFPVMVTGHAGGGQRWKVWRYLWLSFPSFTTTASAPCTDPQLPPKRCP